MNVKLQKKIKTLIAEITYDASEKVAYSEPLFADESEQALAEGIKDYCGDEGGY